MVAVVPIFGRVPFGMSEVQQVLLSTRILHSLCVQHVLFISQ